MLGAFRLNTLSAVQANAGLSYAYSSNTTTSTGSISVSSFPTGSFMVLVSTAIASSGLPATVTPSGWTEATNITDGNQTRTTINTRIKVAGDSTASVMTGGFGNGAVCIAYIPSTTIATITAFTQGVAWSTTAKAQNLTMTGITGPYIMIGVTAGYTTLNTVSNTVTPTRIITSSIANFVIYESTSSAVSFSSSTMTTDDVGFQMATGCRLNLA